MYLRQMGRAKVSAPLRWAKGLGRQWLGPPGSPGWWEGGFNRDWGLLHRVLEDDATGMERDPQRKSTHGAIFSITDHRPIGVGKLNANLMLPAREEVHLEKRSGGEVCVRRNDAVFELRPLRSGHRCTRDVHSPMSFVLAKIVD